MANEIFGREELLDPIARGVYPYGTEDNEPEQFKCIGCEEYRIDDPEEECYINLSVGKYCIDCIVCDNTYEFSESDNELVKRKQIDIAVEVGNKELRHQHYISETRQRDFQELINERHKVIGELKIKQPIL